MSNNVTQEFDKTAFGELLVANLTSAVQVQFPYNINTEIVLTNNNVGTSVVENNMLKLSSGIVANQSAEMMSIAPVRYNPGKGVLIRFTALFTTGLANSEQVIGVGSTSDGLFFGYNGTNFGVLRRQGGDQEVRVLTITTGSTTAENVTITLSGDAKTDVAVTNNGSVYVTANEIASADYSAIGRGWDAHSPGDGTVIFKSYGSIVSTGTYSLSSATTAVGAFAQTIAGKAPVDTWVNQTSWNGDVADGTSDLPAIDKTKGNVYQIRYQWLGYGAISFYIQHPFDGTFHLVHRIEYSNSNSIPSIDNPTLPLYASAQNYANTSDIILRTASLGGYTEGSISDDNIHHGISVEYAGVGTTETPVLTIHNQPDFQGKENRVRVKVTLISYSADGTKPSTVRVKMNSILTNASYVDINVTNSVVNYDVSATTISGGDEQFASGLGKSDSDKIDLTSHSFYIEPGNFLTVSVKASSSTVDGVVSINWEELF